jgi:hypothetical protein
VSILRGFERRKLHQPGQEYRFEWTALSLPVAGACVAPNWVTTLDDMGVLFFCEADVVM